MPVTDDILERTRHLNDLKSMAEKTILQAFVLVIFLKVPLLELIIFIICQ